MSYEKHKTKLFNQYPAIEDLARRAQKRMPFVAWEYLDAGTGRERLANQNVAAFNEIVFTPRFCKGVLAPKIETTVLGQSFNAPFGMAPVGLTGLMWPRAEVLLAQAAQQYRVPFTLSTVATETPETVGKYAGEMGWFQLYPPRDMELCRKLLARAWESGMHTLLVTADVPMASRRERTKRAGLQMPPKITPQLIWQGVTHPNWTLETLSRGLPRLRAVEDYAQYKNMRFISGFVGNRLGGTLDWEYCKTLRAEWKGPLVLKGILHPQDAAKAVEIGFDGLVVSNHGGRQFDGAITSIEALPAIVKEVKGKAAILLDSGVRSGLDIMRAISMGADFVLLGRAFIFGVAALGKYGGHHVIEILMDDLKNNMVQLGIESLSKLRKEEG